MITSGTQTLLIATVALRQTTLGGFRINIAPGAVFWARTTDATGLVSGNLASYTPDDTTPPPAEPPLTVNNVFGLGAGTSNCGR